MLLGMYLAIVEASVGTGWAFVTALVWARMVGHTSWSYVPCILGGILNLIQDLWSLPGATSFWAGPFLAVFIINRISRVL